MELPAMPEQGLDEFLFQLPNRPLGRDERLELIKQVIARGEGITQEHLDRVMTRLLDELQSSR
jgi:hypothetical protein